MSDVSKTGKVILSLIKSTAYLLGAKISDDDMVKYGQLIEILVKYKDDPEFTARIGAAIDELMDEIRTYEALKAGGGKLK